MQPTNPFLSLFRAPSNPSIVPDTFRADERAGERADMSEKCSPNESIRSGGGGAAAAGIVLRSASELLRWASPLRDILLKNSPWLVGHTVV